MQQPKFVIKIFCGAERLNQSLSFSGGVAHTITDQELKSKNVLLDVSCIVARPADGNPDYVCHPVRLCDAVQGLLTALKCSWVQLSSLCFYWAFKRID